jgi:hypothetical protein
MRGGYGKCRVSRSIVELHKAVGAVDSHFLRTGKQLERPQLYVTHEEHMLLVDSPKIRGAMDKDPKTGADLFCGFTLVVLRGTDVWLPTRGLRDRGMRRSAL